MAVPELDLESELNRLESAEKGKLTNNSAINSNAPFRPSQDETAQHRTAILSRVPNLNTLLDVDRELNDDIAYFKHLSDDEIKNYFSKWPDAHINSRADLEHYIQARKYVSELQNIPLALEKINKSMTNFDSLKSSFEASINHIYRVVADTGFNMNEEGCNARERYDGHIILGRCKKNNKVVRLNMKFKDDNKIDLYLFPQYKQIIKQGKVEKFLGMKKLIDSTEIESIRILPEKFVDYQYGYYSFMGGRFGFKRYESDVGSAFLTCSKNRMKIISNSEIQYICDGPQHFSAYTPSACLDEFNKEIMKDPNFYFPIFESFMKNIFNLPRYMRNYTENANQIAQSVLTSLSDVAARRE